MQAFDARTDELIRNARAKVGGELLGEGDLGPAGRELRDFRAEREQARRSAERQARLAALSLAKAEETEEEKASRLRELAAYQAEIAMDDREMELQRLAELEQQAAAAALETERARIRDERAILKERFDERYSAIVAAFEREEITAEEAQRRVLALLSDPGYAEDFKNAGGLIGEAFAKSFASALSAVDEAVRALRASLNELSDAAGRPRTVTDEDTGAPRVEEEWERALRVRSEGLNRKYAEKIRRARGFAAGGRVPGSYVGREDTVMARVTPGEYVLDRGLTERLERALGGAGGGAGGGGTPIIDLRGSLFLGANKQVAEFIGQELAANQNAMRLMAPPMADEQARIISYRHERA